MNGRVYDSTLGRFISADPHIQAPYNSQSLNRYSYVLNNPLSYTDPSGFFFKKLFKKFRNAIKKIFNGVKGFWKSILKNEYIRLAVSIGLAIYGIPGYLENIMMKGFASGFVGSGGDLKAGVIGALSAGAFDGIGTYAKNYAIKTGQALSTAAQAVKTLAHGVVGGLASVANGGSFKSGFLSAGFTEAFSGTAQKLSPQNSAAIDPGQVVIAATIGGAGSVIGGGKFANGAITGAFSNVFNQQEHGDLLRSYEGENPDGNGELRPLEGAAGEWRYEKIAAISDIPIGLATLKKTFKEYALDALQVVDVEIQVGTRYVAEHTPTQFYTYDVYVDRVTFKPTTRRFNKQNTRREWLRTGNPAKQSKLRVCIGGSSFCIN